MSADSKINVVVYARVSGKGQNCDRQVEILINQARIHGYQVLAIFEEIASATRKNHERTILKEMISFCQENEVQKVLVWELSRISRNVVHCLGVLDQLESMGVSLYIQQYNMETLNPDGSKNPFASLMVSILSTFAQTEAEHIKERMKTGMARFLAKGGKVGRKIGYRKSNQTFISQNRDVFRYLSKGFSIRETMKLTGRSSGVVQKARRLIQNTKKLED